MNSVFWKSVDNLSKKDNVYFRQRNGKKRRRKKETEKKTKKRDRDKARKETQI